MSFLKLHQASTIFVACPGNTVTGGPELLHQLVHELRKLNIKAFMYYYDTDTTEPAPAYKVYNNPVSPLPIDAPQNLLIVPEVKTELLSKFPNSQKAIWWLSVDNYYKSFPDEWILRKWSKRLLEWLALRPERFIIEAHAERRIHHLVQSHYAQQHLLSNGIDRNSIYYLSDYLNSHFILSQSSDNSNKKDIVVYNPKKGSAFTQKIIESCPHIVFKPIENMTREQVSHLLSEAKLYIDFGNHPGKDRIPREAAISGSCIITSKSGSASYYKDLPIDSTYKFDSCASEIPRIIATIIDCLDNFELHSPRFDTYREMIRSEQEKFRSDVRSIFSS